MASDVVSDAVCAFLKSSWTDTPIQFENEPPVETYDPDGTPTPWIMMEITGTLYGQQSIGASLQSENRWDEEGQVFIHCFVPIGTGSAEVRKNAKTIADIFRGNTLLNGSLEFGDAAIGMGEIGSDNGKWFRVSVSIEYRRIDA